MADSAQYGTRYRVALTTDCPMQITTPPPATDPHFNGPVGLIIAALGGLATLGTLVYRAFRVVKSDRRFDSLDDAQAKVVEGLTRHIERLEATVEALVRRVESLEAERSTLRRTITDQSIRIIELCSKLNIIPKDQA